MDTWKPSFSNKRELKEAEIIKKIRWAQALEACEMYHNDLMDCRKKSTFAFCTKENELFWKCLDNAVQPGKSSTTDEKPS